MSLWRFGSSVLLIALVGCNGPTVELKVDCLNSIHRVAVLDFCDAPGADAGHSGKVVASIVAQGCLAVEGWTLVEREHMREILVEQDFQTTGVVSRDSAVELGKLLGADGIIIGEAARYRIGSIPFVFFSTLDQDVHKVEFAFRLVSVETGEVCLGARASRESLASFERAIGDAVSEVFQAVIAARQGGLKGGDDE